MNPQILALLTAIFWGVGGFFEKKGLHLGNLSPVMGITIRTAVALIILGTASAAELKTVSQAGVKPLLYMVIGGDIVAGAAGMLCYYVAIKGAPLSKVMPIAFTSPLFGALMGVLYIGEALTPQDPDRYLSNREQYHRTYPCLSLHPMARMKLSLSGPFY